MRSSESKAGFCHEFRKCLGLFSSSQSGRFFIQVSKPEQQPAGAEPSARAPEPARVI